MLKKFFGLTVLLSVATFSGSNVLACTTYWNPRINGREVDRCINSHRYPDGCSRGATERAADRFCEEMGRGSARSWQWQDQSTDSQRDVFKLLEEPGSSYFRIVRGSFIFTGITCSG